MGIIDFFESAYKASQKYDGPEERAWQSVWLSKFQKNTYACQWPCVRDALLGALKDGKMDLVIDCFWASQIASEFHPDDLPAIVVWGLKRACSIAMNRKLYEQLNVSLDAEDIRGESFYAGFPLPNENDIELGERLNDIDIFKTCGGKHNE